MKVGQTCSTFFVSNTSLNRDVEERPFRAAYSAKKNRPLGPGAQKRAFSTSTVVSVERLVCSGIAVRPFVLTPFLNRDVEERRFSAALAQEKRAL
jgi:hypothetical protein